MKSLCRFELEGAGRAGPAAAEFGGARPVGGEVSGCAGLLAEHTPGLAFDGPDDAIAAFCNWTPSHAPGAVFRSGEAAAQSGAYGEYGFVPAKMDGPVFYGKLAAGAGDRIEFSVKRDVRQSLDRGWRQ